MKTILLVDDDESITDMLKLYLEGEGFAVRVAHDGEEGLKIAQTTRPDLMILDLNMPKMKGAGVFSCLLGSDGKSIVPVIVLTGQGNMESMYSDLGIQAFFTKPPNMTQFVEKIREIIAVNSKKDTKSSTEGNEGEESFRFKGEELSSVNLSRLTDKIGKKEGLIDDKKPTEDLHGVADKVPVEGIEWKRKHHIKNVIVFENDDRHFRGIQSYFKAGPYNLICVKTREELLILLKSLLPDLALIKLELPEISGHDLVLEIRHDRQIKFFPILLYTHLNNHRIKKLTFESVMKGTFHINGLKDLIETDDPELIFKKADELLKELETKKKAN